MFGFNALIVYTRRHSDFLKNFVHYYYDIIHVQHISITQELHRAYYFYKENVIICVIIVIKVHDLLFTLLQVITILAA